ncbi:hypothetical protein D3C79_826720 [compost metagenome]
MSDENLANGLVAALDQGLQLTVHRCQGLAQLLPFLGTGLPAQGVVELTLDTHMGRATGNAGGSAHALNPATGRGGLQHLGGNTGNGLRTLRQRLHLFTQALFDSGQQRR